VPTDAAGADEPVELVVGPVAHGGHCVARLDGRVVFVRHALPGERVRARVTETSRSFWRADAVEVLEASPDRVTSVWPAAGPGGVGGGELAHVALGAQRSWKRAVLEEQLRRLAHDERAVPVLAAPGDDERGGLAWRTRIDLVADAAGRAGMYRHRSHEVLALDSMPLASEAVAALGLFDRRWPAGSRIEAVVPAGAEGGVVLVDGVPFDLARGRVDPRPNARSTVREQVRTPQGHWTYRVAAAGFWQVHREAPAVLVDAALRAAGELSGARVLDLYSGAGLFTLPLADAVGADGSVLAVEGDDRAVRDARRAVHDRPQVTLRGGDVARVLASGVGRADVVVLDPPRTGAGWRVVDEVAALAPARVVYVACDPAALARDVAWFAAAGYGLAELTGYDLFPMTHHVEAVALLTR
jgi:tRNA/tmRNA/rRNA uracil-C5-methylase (TrmA/RlmC/RlmD family)